jgi:hypothetical protein
MRSLLTASADRPDPLTVAFLVRRRLEPSQVTVEST